jgi:hypothetical protein
MKTITTAGASLPCAVALARGADSPRLTDPPPGRYCLVSVIVNDALPAT